MDAVDESVVAALGRARASVSPEAETVSGVQNLCNAAKARLATFEASTQSKSYAQLLPCEAPPSSNLTPMRAHGGKTPSISPSPLDEDGTERHEIAIGMVQSPSRKEQKRLRDVCLERDGWRCIITGIWDAAAEGKFPEEIIGFDLIKTEAAHIIPFCLGNYGRTGEHEENVYNISTFHGFQKWLFRALPPKNEHGQRLIKLESRSHTRAPSRELLAIHAAIARILHAFGRAQAIDVVVRDLDESRYLEADGSTDIGSFLEVLAF